MTRTKECFIVQIEDEKLIFDVLLFRDVSAFLSFKSSLLKKRVTTKERRSPTFIY